MRTDHTFTTDGEETVLAVSLELAPAKWKVALHDGRREKPAVLTVAQPQTAARLQAVLDLIGRTTRSGPCRRPCASSSATRPPRTASGSIARCRLDT